MSKPTLPPSSSGEKLQDGDQDSLPRGCANLDESWLTRDSSKLDSSFALIPQEIGGKVGFNSMKCENEIIFKLIKELDLPSNSWEKILMDCQAVVERYKLHKVSLKRQFKKEFDKLLFRILINLQQEPHHNLLKRAFYACIRVFFYFFSKKIVIFPAVESALEKAAYIQKTQNLPASFSAFVPSAFTEQEVDLNFIKYIEIFEEKNNCFSNVVDFAIKLSTLYISGNEISINSLVLRLRELLSKAQENKVRVILAAEETFRNGLILEVFEKLFADPIIQEWDNLGITIQTYQKNAIESIDWLHRLAVKQRKKILLRLVKGAYWGAEINEFPENPLFTSKLSTDISYLTCARKALDLEESFQVRFATHDLNLVVLLNEIAKNQQCEFEFLYGFGSRLYSKLGRGYKFNVAFRPWYLIGDYKQILPDIANQCLDNLSVDYSFNDQYDAFLREYSQLYENKNLIEILALMRGSFC